MRNAKLTVASAWLVVGVTLSTANSATGSELGMPETPVTGVVVSVTGSRFDIQLSDGSVQSVTTQQVIPEDLVGKSVTGQVAPIGDSYLILNPVFGE